MIRKKKQGSKVRPPDVTKLSNTCREEHIGAKSSDLRNAGSERRNKAQRERRRRKHKRLEKDIRLSASISPETRMESQKKNYRSYETVEEKNLLEKKKGGDWPRRGERKAKMSNR